MSVRNPLIGTGSGGRKAAVSISGAREIWCHDFEFEQASGERPCVVCMVAIELRSGRVVRLWRDDLLNLREAPFDVGPDSLVVAFYAVAELACFLELGWSLPANVLDLWAEHRVATNGAPRPYGDGLLGVLTSYGLAHIDPGEKESMRRLIIEGRWRHADRGAVLNYCETDVRALLALLPRMEKSIDLPRALVRGRYMGAVARMERNGVPLDAPLHRQLLSRWEPLKRDLIAEVDREFGVYDGTVFKEARFELFLRARRIPWPRHASSSLILDDSTFADQAKRWRVLQPLRELRSSLGSMRLVGMSVGQDGRNRCSLSPFGAVTGRNTPSTNAFVFGPSKWMRGLIRPPEGFGLAYIDYSSQEIGIAAALSGDERMIEGYREGTRISPSLSCRAWPLTTRLNSHTAAFGTSARPLCSG